MAVPLLGRASPYSGLHEDENVLAEAPAGKLEKGRRPARESSYTDYRPFSNPYEDVDHGFQNHSRFESVNTGQSVESGDGSNASSWAQAYVSTPAYYKTPSTMPHGVERAVGTAGTHYSTPHHVTPLPPSTQAPGATPGAQEAARSYVSPKSSEDMEPDQRIDVNAKDLAGHEHVADITHDPITGPKDNVVLRQMAIKEDYDEHLEEFSRLKRLGRIIEARILFQRQLGHLMEIPYVRAQYAEMLVSAGGYKRFKGLSNARNSLASVADPDSESPSARISMNFRLLDLLSQPDMPFERYTEKCLRTMYDVARALEAETVFGSTEIQLIVLCLRLLQHLTSSTRDDIVQEVRQTVQNSIAWNDIYRLLLHEDRVWDFKDLLVALVPVFGWQEVGSRLFGKSSFSELLLSIEEDWMGSGYDEPSIVALLDIFTTSVLQDGFGKNTYAQTVSCLEHARKLSELVLKNHPQNATSRPFIQWILAKAAFELYESAGSQRVDALEEHPGLLLRQDDGVQLPVFVPQNHEDRPDWHLFCLQPEATQEGSLKVALKSARCLGDYNLQSLCLKLLILQSSDPASYMNDLATLQLETQEDKEGYLGTCLSRYLVSRPPMTLASFQRDIKRLDPLDGGSYSRIGINAPFQWARSMIRLALLSDEPAQPTSNSFITSDRNSFLLDELAIYGSRLPDYITDYLQVYTEIDVPRPFQPLRPTKLRSSGSTHSGRPTRKSHPRPRRIRSEGINKETRDEDQDHYGVRVQTSIERQRLLGRFQMTGRYDKIVPTRLDPPVEGWPPTWRADAERLAADAQYRQDMNDLAEYLRLGGNDYAVENEQDDISETTSDKGVLGADAMSTTDNNYEHDSDFDEEWPKVICGDDGWPDFQIPRSFLRNNTMHVTLNSKSRPYRSRTYILKGKGLHEAEVEVQEHQVISDKYWKWSTGERDKRTGEAPMVDGMPVLNASRKVRVRQKEEFAPKSSYFIDAQTDGTSSSSMGSPRSEAHCNSTAPEREGKEGGEGGEAGSETGNPSPEEHTDEVRSEINGAD